MLTAMAEPAADRNTPTLTEYLRLEWAGSSPSGKTQRWVVLNRKSGDLLGYISWHATWRQYVLLPEGSTVFSAGCLRDIEDFISDRMQERIQ